MVKKRIINYDIKVTSCNVYVQRADFFQKEEMLIIVRNQARFCDIYNKEF